MAAPAAADECVRESFEAIYTCAEHGAQVVQQLQDFTGSQPRPDQDLLDLGQLVQTVAQEHWDTLHQTRQSLVALRLEVRAAEDLHVMASAADVREIIGNLLDNAREAMPEGGEVTVTVTREKRQAVVRLSDRGTGMDPEVVAHCCEPFYTTRGGEHLGLGLSVVHGIVTRSGGRFTVADNEHGGTTATIALPLADLRAVRRELRHKRDEAPTLLRNLHVLVVDDEPGLRAWGTK
jgi:signal transduction histidine kinase